MKEEKIRPNHLLLFMTEQCNLRCKYCFETGTFKNTYMDIATLQRVLDMMMESDDGAVNDITLFGGEPTLNKVGMEYLIDKYIEYKEAGKKNIINFGINTNFYNIDEDMDRILDKYIKFSNFNLGVSMDATKHIHDKYRVTVGEQPTFDKVYANMWRYRKKYGPKLYINAHSVLYKDALANIEDVFEAAIYNMKSGLCTEVSLCYTTPYTTPEELTYEEIEHVYSVYYDKYIDDSRLCDEKKSRVFDMLITETGFYEPKCGSCRAGMTDFAIMTNGDIKICHKYKVEDDEKHIIHNIHEYDDNYVHIKKNGRFNDYLDRDDRLETGDFKLVSELGYDCNKCKFASVCHPCIARSELSTGDIHIKGKEVCMRTMIQADLAMKYEMIKIKKETLGAIQRQNEYLERLANSVKANTDLTLLNHRMVGEIYDAKFGGEQVDENK